MLDHDFTTQYDSFGTLETCELVPDGSNIPVTETNKLEYIRLLCEHRLQGRVAEQIKALKHGLGEIVPLKELRVFDEKELELLIGGVETIDVEDWYVCGSLLPPPAERPFGSLTVGPARQGTPHRLPWLYS